MPVPSLLRRRPSHTPLALCAATAAATLAFAPDARAQVVERFTLRGELGGGTMFPQYQRDMLGQTPLVQGTGRLGFSLIEPLAIQASFGSWYFPGDHAGQVYSITGGLRFEPRIGSLGRLFVDGNAGLAITGPLDRFTFDVGVGFEFALTRWLGLGPVVRYAHVLHNDANDFPSDAQYWSAGLSLALRVPPREQPPAIVAEPPRDTDRDGVMDPDDLCPTVPAGDHPDAARRGCPAGDADHDGVLDADDLCPNEPQGEHPDPARRGCPEPDSDHDGVLDHADQCPTTPAGEHPNPERAGCPDGDADADGVLDHADQCRTEPQGLHPDPARAGCPLPDRDRDTVPDPTDHCPDQPGAPSPDPNRNGCPGLVLLENGVIRISRPVYFATNRDVILPRSLPVLQAVADALRATPEIHRVSIEGHTDNVGDAEHNMDLSQRRANSVMTWLTAHGIDAPRLEAHGFGQTRSIESNSTARGRGVNRRVEFHITDPAGVQPTVPAGESPAPPTH